MLGGLARLAWGRCLMRWADFDVVFGTEFDGGMNVHECVLVDFYW
ncbi:hypothetical protein [Moraxella lacunata]